MSTQASPRTLAARITVGAFAVLAAMQLVPYGRAHENPPVVQEPSWDRAETRALAVRACFDCHSNETKWPWYSNVAPASWLVQDHIDEGRRKLNFSEWQRSYKDAHEASEEVSEGDMPLPSYTLLHPEAVLSRDETLALARGLAATLGTGKGQRDDRD